MPPSNRPSPRAATEDDGADSPAASGLRATPPRPNKRSSRAKSSSRRRRRSPNPNPRPRPDYYGTEPSRKSERKRKPRSFPDAALLSRALLPRASPSGAAGAGGGGNVQLWTDADELALLSGAVAFRASSGRAPRLPDTDPLFESIRDSLSPHIDQSKVYLRTPPWSPMLSKSCLSPAAFSSAFTEFRNSGPSPGLPMAPPRTSPESSTSIVLCFVLLPRRLPPQRHLPPLPRSHTAGNNLLECQWGEKRICTGICGLLLDSGAGMEAAQVELP
ncbi:uncharacterized protein LOC124669523 [Lolium rigidum]|uniref:uncharacterized protein LOC124669523 n=1 Tax=Lolium rigidum TaxID=89674 RepID=UPI001F5CD5FB|nr:uncharacterized protein LOC124669523 [Lolium rigidum]